MNIVQSCPRQRGKTIVGTALAAVVGFTAPAVGQFGEAAGFADSMQPDLFSRDLVVFSEVLDLDESQRLIVEALFTDHQEDFQLGLQNMRNRFDEMRDEFTGNDVKRIMTLVFLPFQEWRGEKEILRQEFMENVKVMLTEEQLERWPSLERRLLREKSLGKGRLSGERVNLLHLVRDLHLDPPLLEHLQPLLLQYELVLDQAGQHVTVGQVDDLCTVRNSHVGAYVHDLALAVPGVEARQDDLVGGDGAGLRIDQMTGADGGERRGEMLLDDLRRQLVGPVLSSH